jgi:hypothetical protein
MVGRKGVPINPGILRPMLLAPLYAGLRSHSPGVVKRHHRSANATVVAGTWEPLVSRDLFETVRRRLTDPARKTSRPGRAVHLLSTIAHCHHCDARLAATYRDGVRRMYQCQGRNCVRVDADALDAYAAEAMLEWLTRPESTTELLTDDGDDAAVAAARDRVAAIRAELDDLADRLGNGELSATLAARAEAKILARLAAATAELDAVATPPALRGLVPPADEVRQWWADPTLQMPARREVAKLLLSPALLGELRVTRSPRPGQRVDVAERVVWRR